MTYAPSRTTHRAFTLIEVLVATIVLGLGVLGLSALFAGAATQQQTAASVSRSVAFTQSGVGLLGEKLSGIYNAGGSATVPDGTWDALVSDDPSTRLGGVLRTAFASFPLASSSQFGFLTDATSGVFGTIEDVPPGVYSLPTTPLRHDRIWIGDGFEIRIRLYTGVFGEGREIAYSMDTRIGPLGDPALQQFLMGNAPPPNLVRLWLNGRYRDPASPGDFVTLNTGFDGGAAVINGQILVPPVTGGNSSWRNGEIVSSGYRWFDDLLVSINDRTQYISSETAPNGRLPVMSYHVLYRESNGIAEVAVLTYSLRPLSALRNRRDELPFIPPDTREDFAADEAVLREIEVRLGQDEAGNYYIVPIEDDNDWVVESGQILLMSSIDGAASAPTSPGVEPDPGADTPVRVLTVRTIDGERRAILEDSPRIGSRSVLENPNDTIDIHVWAVAPLVRSRSSDRTEWQLTPVEASTFKLVF
jgi:prepilin-type N-terminal cleavage/methylation domain-containing protein